MSNLAGQIILHYKIIEQVGQGGMGVVYLAEDKRLKRNVAIKFLPQQISSDPEQKKRFETEAQAAASLNHPNITTIHAIEDYDEG
ncbi:MAG TPA: protein kinase, partial [Ignavibacteriaceae bacterium]|nr:protein kinase [Ignavibacteriaceae bacterium]